MTLPSLDDQRGRETAVAAERHHWSTRLAERVARWREEAARMKANDHKFPDRFAVERCADELAALLAERP
jgi:hypothetical protein